MGKIYNWE